MSSMNCDIGIVGGGPVGAAFALAAADTRWRLALVEPRRPMQPEGWDVRIYAVSPQNRRFLERIGVWAMMDRSRLNPVRRMLVFGGEGARLEFSAYESGVPELAWILEAGAITRAMWSRMEAQANLQIFCPAAPVRLDVAPEQALLGLEDGRNIGARLVVGADGARSFVRQAAGLVQKPHPDRQMGVVANFHCQRPHGNTAFQWFRQDGVLAWLPLAGQRMSMVWSTSEARASELLALSGQQLCEEVGAAGQGVLGQLEVITPAAAFPIARFRLPGMTAARIALVGDAAHVVHPLAGQGVNLGFQDAAALAGLLAAVRGDDAGDPAALRRYERARKEDILAMRVATDGLDWLYHSEAPGIAGVRDRGLNLVNQLPVLKGLLTRHALG